MAVLHVCSFCKEQHGGPPCPFLLDAMAFDLRNQARKKFQLMYSKDYSQRIKAHIRAIALGANVSCETIEPSKKAVTSLKDELRKNFDDFIENG
jgi:hypothetical protein